MTKRADRVGFWSIGLGLGRSGCGSRHVIFKTDQSGCRSIGSWVKSGPELRRVDSYFSNFFFLEIDAICQLFMSFLTVIRFSLVILLSITTKHLIPKFGTTLVLEANLGIIFDLFKVGRENECDK